MPIHNRYSINPVEDGFHIVVEVFRYSYEDAIKALEDRLEDIKDEYKTYMDGVKPIASTS